MIVLFDKILDPISLFAILVFILLIHDIPEIFQTYDDYDDLTDTPIIKSKFILEKVTKKKVQGLSGSMLTVVKLDLIELDSRLPLNENDETPNPIQFETDERTVTYSQRTFEPLNGPFSVRHPASCPAFIDHKGLFVLPSFG